MTQQTYTLREDVRPTKLLVSRDILTWKETISFIQRIPYGRTSDRSDLSLVVSEGRGTCSSKHALLKVIADQNNIPDVKLILAMYKMNKSNTPGIGDVLVESGLGYIPEAHCYLSINRSEIDVTNINSNISRITKDILLKQEIEPHQIGNYKVEFHKNFLKQWMFKEKIKMSFDQVWEIREQCIKNLSQA